MFTEALRDTHAQNIARPMAMTGSMVSSEAVLKLSGTSPRIADSKGRRRPWTVAGSMRRE